MTDNKIETKRKPGRPLKFESVEVMQKLIDKYFEDCDKGEMIEEYDKKTGTVIRYKQKIPYTITGLALALDTSRQALINYEDKPEYFDAIKRAKLRCEHYAEMKLMSGNGNPAGPIFALKNYNWSDKSEMVHSGNANAPLKWEVEVTKPDRLLE